MRTLLCVALLLLALLPCTPGLFVSASRASEINHSTTVKEIAPQGTGKDVAVTSIVQVGPPFVIEGNTVTITIGVANNGAEEETFIVSLRDDTANEHIGSKDVTLAAGGSSAISIAWDTEGATGGPAPPGPPTPGTIHAITAVATLAGDTVESNNSMSLLPGIWVIANPKPSEITFPENSKEPEAKKTSGMASETPSLDTVVEPLEESYVSPVSIRERVPSSVPSIDTSPTSLPRVFNTPVAAKASSAFDRPEIATVAAPVPRITADDVKARMDQSLTFVGVSTVKSPLNGVFLHQALLHAVNPVSRPALTPQADSLTRPFATASDFREYSELTRPDIGTDPTEAERIVTRLSQANRENSLTGPGVTTTKTPLNEVFLFQVQLSAANPILAPAIATTANDAERVVGYVSQSNLAGYLAEPAVANPKAPLRTLFVPLSGTDTEEPLAIPDLGTKAEPLDAIFWTPAAASLLLQGRRPEMDTQIVPALLVTGTIRGRVRLQGRANSLGSYVEIGNQVAFADRRGYFELQRPPGNFDLTVNAPGHLSHTVRDISLEADSIVLLPTVTLSFGDGDGDGLIDIYDLALAAGNYGGTASKTWFR